MTTVGPYTVEVVEMGGSRRVQLTEELGSVTQVHRSWAGEDARELARSVRQLADLPDCPNPDVERGLADALEQAAREL